MKEIWKPIQNLDGYEVSNLGRIRSYRISIHKRGSIGSYPYISKDFRFLKSNRNCRDGRIQIRLNGKNYKVHNLVCQTFIGPRPNNKVVDHINRDYSDNRLENLRYISQSLNCRNTQRSSPIQSIKGVSWRKAMDKWEAYRRIGRKKIHLGFFSNEEDAIEEVRKAG